jgi:hypothetical protein
MFSANRRPAFGKKKTLPIGEHQRGFICQLERQLLWF